MKRCLTAIVGQLLLASTTSFRMATPRQHRAKLAAPLKALPACPVDELPNPDIVFLDKSQMVSKPEVQKSPDAIVYPLFPLGQTVYLPGSQHTLNIFEPRYRQMYNDILLSGSRSFAVCMTAEDGQSVAETAAIFYLEDLKEVSAQTQDQVKYVCQHKVVKRVKLKKVLNPKAWRDTSTYLRVEVDEVDAVVDASTALSTTPAAQLSAQATTAEAVAAAAETTLAEVTKSAPPAAPTTAAAAEAEAAATAAALAEEEYLADYEELCRDMDEVVELQNSFQEEPRFSPNLKSVFRPATLVGAAAEAQLWALASLWQAFATERVSDVQRRGSAQVEDVLMTYLTKNGTIDAKKLAGRELVVPEQLQQEIRAMTARVRQDMEEKLPTTTLPYQQLLQTPARGERVRILRRIVVEEKRRLAAKASLRSLFS